MDIKIQSKIYNYRRVISNLFPGYSGINNNKTIKPNMDYLILGNTLSKDRSSKMISNSFLDVINFDTKSLVQYVDEGLFSIGGTFFSRAQIPEVSSSRLNELKAVNNVLTIQNGKYYKYIDAEGDIHKMSCYNNSLSTVYSEYLRGIIDEESGRCGRFWSILSENGTFIREYYSDEEIKNYLHSAGITEGFFTVNVGNDSQEYFYSNGNSGRTVLKSIYDTQYNVIKNRGTFFSYHEPGTVIKVDGKEYVLSENHTLDIPYGEDIFNIECPPRKIT